MRSTSLYPTLLISLLLTACASTETYSPARVESRSVESGALSANCRRGEPCERSQDVATPLAERSLDLQRAEYFSRQAQQSRSAYAQIEATLSAAEYYVQADRSEEAQRLLSGLFDRGIGVTQFNQQQKDRTDVINAYAGYKNNDCGYALNTLRRILPQQRTVEFIDPRTTPEYKELEDLRAQELVETTINRPLDREVLTQPRYSEAEPLSAQQIDALLLASFCYQQLGDVEAALSALIQRENGLQGTARAQSTRYTWQVINGIPALQRELLIDQVANGAVRARLEQSLGGGFTANLRAIDKFTNLERSSGQTGTSLTQEKVRIAPSWDSGSVRQIAVLLPLSSKFNKAATAVLDGIKYQHELNTSSYAPELLVYDIGADPLQIGQYYQAAINQGAELVIGPLGNDFADQLSAVKPSIDRSRTNTRNARQWPAILLGGQNPVGRESLRLSLSPEAEGRSIAQHAFEQGYLSAAVIAPKTNRAARLIEGFERSWQSLGGKVSARTSYSSKQFDHSVELKMLFNHGASNYRASQLKQALDVAIEHNAYQRQDIDFVLLIANDDTGRIIRPQINFFSDSKIPVYSGAAIYNGVPDQVNNMDLNNTWFPIMPWV
ncbi:MAG: penicillin-binding protein activator, partial [Pseudomonadota bacterium]